MTPAREDRVPAARAIVAAPPSIVRVPSARGALVAAYVFDRPGVRAVACCTTAAARLLDRAVRGARAGFASAAPAEAHVFDRPGARAVACCAAAARLLDRAVRGACTGLALAAIAEAHVVDRAVRGVRAGLALVAAYVFDRPGARAVACCAAAARLLDRAVRGARAGFASAAPAEAHVFDRPGVRAVACCTTAAARMLDRAVRGARAGFANAAPAEAHVFDRPGARAVACCAAAARLLDRAVRGARAGLTLVATAEAHVVDRAVRGACTGLALAATAAAYVFDRPGARAVACCPTVAARMFDRVRGARAGFASAAPAEAHAFDRPGARAVACCAAAARLLDHRAVRGACTSLALVATAAAHVVDHAVRGVRAGLALVATGAAYVFDRRGAHAVACCNTVAARMLDRVRGARAGFASAAPAEAHVFDRTGARAVACCAAAARLLDRAVRGARAGFANAAPAEAHVFDRPVRAVACCTTAAARMLDRAVRGARAGFASAAPAEAHVFDRPGARAVACCAAAARLLDRAVRGARAGLTLVATAEAHVRGVCAGFANAAPAAAYVFDRRGARVVACCATAARLLGRAVRGARAAGLTLAAPAEPHVVDRAVPRTRQRAVSGAGAAFALGAMFGCTGVDGVVDGGDDALVFHACDAHDAAGFECATLAVPKDRDLVSSDAHIALAIMRRPASRPALRLGALFVNFGGPRESVAPLPSHVKMLPPAVLDRFDVIAVDGRGVGGSAPLVECPALDAALGRLFARSPGELARDAEDVTSAARVCREQNHGMLDLVGSERTADDLDAVRDALGEDTISLYGASYGTVVAAAYADRHEDHLRALVLDSVMRLSPTFDDEDAARQLESPPDAGPQKPLPPEVEAMLARAIHTFDALHDVEKECDRDPKCPVYPNSKAAVRAFQDRVNAGEIPGVTAKDFQSARDTAIARGPQPQRRFLAALAMRDPAAAAKAILALAGERKTIVSTRRLYYLATHCTDGIDDESFLDDVVTDVAGGGRARLPRCALLGIEPRPIRFSLLYRPRVPSLVLTPKDDVRTPATFAATAARILDAPLVTWKGVGHGALDRAPCVRDAVEHFLIDGERPAGDVVCR